MTKLINLKEKVNLGDYTLIIPSVSVGNVPQLTVDLIISSYNLRKLGTLWHPAIIPAVGGDPFATESDNICTACELFASKSLKIAVIQLRSSIEFKLVKPFLVDLKQEILGLKFSNVIILTSSFAYELHNITSGQFRYIGDANLKEKINIPQMEPDKNGTYSIHGSGFAVKLFEALNSETDCTVIIKYASEGDNRPDAVLMLDCLSKMIEQLKKDVVTIKFPSSWNCIFGNPPPIGIY